MISYLARYMMVNSFAKCLAFCICIASTINYEDCFGMPKSKSDSDILSHDKSIQISHERRLSDPVTVQEKAHAIKITSMEQFRKLTSTQAKELRSVTFNGVEISEEFVYKFWELFPRGIDKLVFDGCVTTEDWKFSSLMDGEYEVKKFSVVNSNITLEDVDSILCLVYIYAIESFDFSGNNLNITDFNKCFNNRLGSFVRTVTYSL